MRNECLKRQLILILLLHSDYNINIIMKNKITDPNISYLVTSKPLEHVKNGYKPPGLVF